MADVQSFNTQVISDGAQIATTGASRGIFQRNRPSKRSLPGRSSSQGPAAPATISAASNVMPNPNPTATLSTSVPSQNPISVSQSNHIGYVNQHHDPGKQRI